MKREGFGADNTPDLLSINYKAIDTIGHMFSADGIELSDTLKVQDANLEEFVDFMNRQVGEEPWVMILTPTTGCSATPRSGAFVMDVKAIAARIEETFGQGAGGPVIEKLRPTEVWFNEGALEASGFSFEQVARFVMNLTQEQTGARREEPARARSEQDQSSPGRSHRH